MPLRSSSARGSRQVRKRSLEISGRPIITLLSDFGLADGYVGSMKGVILTICPGAILVDISHEVPAFDVRSAGYVLKTVFHDFPPGTIYIAVVDPGVGTDRRPLAIRTHYRRTLIGPDNGLFSWVLDNQPVWEARSLETSTLWKPVVSSTFHGRDIFAPVAANLARGASFNTLGPSCLPKMGSWISIRREGSELHGEVVHIDRFGNLITNITQQDLEGRPDHPGWGVSLPGRLTLSTLSRTYADQPVGSIAAIIGSSGHLEVSVNQGNAAQVLAVGTGAPVIAFWKR